MVAQLLQQPGAAQADGGVAVVAAGVHTAGMTGLKSPGQRQMLRIRGFFYRQTVNIKAQGEHRMVCPAAVQLCHKPRVMAGHGLSGNDLIAHPLQLGGQKGAGLPFVPGSFRDRVQVPAPGGQLRGQGGGHFFNLSVHTVLLSGRPVRLPAGNLPAAELPQPRPVPLPDRPAGCACERPGKFPAGACPPGSGFSGESPAHPCGWPGGACR